MIAYKTERRQRDKYNLCQHKSREGAQVAFYLLRAITLGEACKRTPFSATALIATPAVDAGTS